MTYAPASIELSLAGSHHPAAAAYRITSKTPALMRFKPAAAAAAAVTLICSQRPAVAALCILLSLPLLLLLLLLC
jgi:hypothetical protein